MVFTVCIFLIVENILFFSNFDDFRYNIDAVTIRLRSTPIAGADSNPMSLVKLAR